MTASARDQLEGLGFLYSYLQRVFVFTRTMQMLDPQRPVDVNADELKAALDLVGDTVRQFDFESGLSAACGARPDHRGGAWLDRREPATAE